MNITINYKKNIKLFTKIVVLTLIVLLFSPSVVLASRTATLSISHSNSSPTVGETDTIHAYVSWSEMNGMDGYMISLIIPKTAMYLNYYDSPSIVDDSSGSSWRFNWFYGSITDSGSNNLCYVTVRYLTSGTFTTYLEFTVYDRIVVGFILWIPVQTWQTSNSWSVSSSTSSRYTTEKIENNNVDVTPSKIISYSTIFNNNTLPKIIKFLENSEEFTEFRKHYSENFYTILGVTSNQHEIIATLVGRDANGHRVYKNIYIPIQIINIHSIEKIV